MSNYKGYYLKSLGLSEDNLPGGKGDETQPNQVDSTELAMGIKVEMEHTQDSELAKEIALDHLTEDPHYYSRLKQAGLADELDGDPKSPSGPPMMQKLLSPVAVKGMQVIGMAVRGTKTGLLPAGGIVADPEKARLGGFERVKNLKPNSQGAIADTPSSDQIKASGGHFTPDNAAITKADAPKTNREGDETIHPFQTQQLGNKPFEDDGTTHDGETTPEAAGGDGRCVDAKSSAESSSDKQDFKPEPEEPSTGEEKPKKGPWGIDIEDEEGEGEDISIDIKETLQAAKETVVKEQAPIVSASVKECDVRSSGQPDLKQRFQKLANIKTDEAGLISELREVVGRLNAKGKVTPTLPVAQRFLKKFDNKK